MNPFKAAKRLWARLCSVPITRAVDYLVGIPLLNLLSLPKRLHRRAWPHNIRRVGVHCSPTTGDTVLFSAVLMDLRKHFGPDVEITHFIGSKNKAAAELLAGANQLVFIDLARPFSAALRIRQQKLDLFFEFSSWQRVTALLALASGSRYTVGFRSIGQHRAGAFDLAVKHRADQHELENFRDLLRSCDIPVGASPAVETSIQSLDEPWSTALDVIVFHLWPAGGKQSRREWHEDNWIELARELANASTIFAITGAPAERQQSELFAKRLAVSANVQAFAFDGGRGLQPLVFLLRKARLTVSVNTGVMHLSAVVGTPTVSLNGPTAEHRWGPRGRCCVGVSPLTGEGGYLHFGFELSSDLGDVMSGITVEQVEQAAHSILDRCGTRALNQTAGEGTAFVSP